MRAVLASAAPGAANAATTAALNIHRKARTRLESAEKAIIGADMVIFPCFLAAPGVAVSLSVKQYGFTVHRCQFRLVLP